MPKERITTRFSQLKERGEGALVVYLMAGDPNEERSLEYILAAVEGGADLLELGIPFSDPVADGPTIQAAGTRALSSGITPARVLKIANQVRKYAPTPIVLMTYYNPILKWGETEFAEEAAGCGVDGLIVPDLPLEEAGSLRQAAQQAGLALVFLATPETKGERLARLAHSCDGFLYLVARYGTTGARETLPWELYSLIARVRSVAPSGLPLAVGFGLSQPNHIREVIRAGADGAVVGSKLVEAVGQGISPERLSSEVNALKEATLP